VRPGQVTQESGEGQGLASSETHVKGCRPRTSTGRCHNNSNNSNNTDNTGSNQEKHT
jgi:hypothetical protein